ncbi:MAG TPA: hypothetical protein VGC76_20000 [Pyrinomonadaceae bacterium]|jgi:hypothetical protein
MLKIGIESAFLYIAALASFVIGMYNPDWFRTALFFCALFFIAASIMLAVKTKSRRKTVVHG